MILILEESARSTASFLTLVQAKRIDHCLRHLGHFDVFLRCKIACQHGILADLLDLVILHA